MVAVELAGPTAAASVDEFPGALTVLLSNRRRVCQRYLKIPQIRRLKIPQCEAEPEHADPGGSGCCDWRDLWRFGSYITTV
jgi:hypothetical protein